MTKTPATIYECSKCGAQSSKWLGRCVECGGWGTVEQRSNEATKQQSNAPPVKLTDFGQIEAAKFPRILTGINEVDRVLGGGIVPGSLILLGGEPGIGKSTLILQIADGVASHPLSLPLRKGENNGSSPLQWAVRRGNGGDDNHLPPPLLSKEGSAQSPPLAKGRRGGVLYVSGEESGEQIKLRFDRLGIKNSGINFLGETDLETIAAAITQHKPGLAIIDSIQTVRSSSVESDIGSVAQIRATTAELLGAAKKNNVPIVIVGHITKDGSLAGPKTLEHLVDTVLYLEGDANNFYRILRGFKNRFGSTDEIGVFEMTGSGMKEVPNPSAALLSETSGAPGTVIAATMEGSRPLLLEIQALTNPTAFGYPNRRTVGFDLNRLSMLIAVLGRRARLNLGNSDVYLNIVGGLKIADPGTDLAAAAAIISSFKDKSLPEKTVFIGEIGLGGEVRQTKAIDKRLDEAGKLGLTRAIVPKTKSPPKSRIEVIPIETVADLIKFIG